MFTVLQRAEQSVTFSLWILPLSGFLFWSGNFLVGVLLNARGTSRTHYLARTLWWSGIGVEALCLVVILSYL